MIENPLLHPSRPSSFSHYLTKMKSQLFQFHASEKEGAQRVEANSPFEWIPPDWKNSPSKKGVLLVHGLLDSPYSLKAIGKIFLKEQFLVRSILLPGHGTSPEELLNVSFKDWVKATRIAVDDLHYEVDELFLVGFSGGASLSLINTAHLKKLKGVALLSPAFQLRSKLLPFARWMATLGNFYPPFTWYERLEENDYAKYQSVSYHLGKEAYELCQFNHSFLSKNPLSCPVFMALSEADETVCPKAALHFFKSHVASHPHESNRCIIYNKNIEVFDSPHIISRTSYFPELHILDFSHVCLPIPLSDPHYGLHGDYVPPLHMLERGENIPVSKIFYGALSRENLQTYSLRRLHFNPDFDFLKRHLQNFIRQCVSAPLD